MGRLVALVLIAATSLALNANVSRGQSMDGEVTSELVLPRGDILVFAPAEINLSSAALLEPTSFAPDVWVGATRAISLGVVSSTFGTSGFYGAGGQRILAGQGAGLCLTGAKRGCPRVFDQVGLAGRYQLMSGRIALAAESGWFLNRFDPIALALAFGAAISVGHGRLQLVASPRILVGLNAREPDLGTGDFIGNKTWLHFPITVRFMITDRLALISQKGLVAPIGSIGEAGFGELFRVPLTTGVSYEVGRTATLGLGISMPAVQGDLYESGTSGRAGTFFVTWRARVSDTRSTAKGGDQQ